MRGISKRTLAVLALAGVTAALPAKAQYYDGYSGSYDSYYGNVYDQGYYDGYTNYGYDPGAYPVSCDYYEPPWGYPADYCNYQLWWEPIL